MIALYWLWRLGMFLVSSLPRKWSYAAAGRIGTSAYYVLSLRRHVALNNFSHVLRKSTRDPHVRRVARESFRNYARLLRDVMIYNSMAYAEIEQRTTIQSPEHFEQAVARGKGTILVTAHYGNMDLASAVVATRFAPVTLISETLKPPQLMNFIVQMRAKHHIHSFDYAHAPRKMLQALKRNEFVATLLDIGVTHLLDLTTVKIDFFGTLTRFVAGPAQFSLLTGAAIVVGIGLVAPDGQIVVHTNAPFVVENSGDRRRDLQAGMQEIGKRLEEFIRQNPAQWYMFRPMWQTEFVG